MKVIQYIYGTWDEAPGLQRAFIIRNGIGEYQAEITYHGGGAYNNVKIFPGRNTKEEAGKDAKEFIEGLK